MQGTLGVVIDGNCHAMLPSEGSLIDDQGLPNCTSSIEKDVFNSGFAYMLSLPVST